MENVSFNKIPLNIRTPGQFIEIDNTKAVQGLPLMDRKILMLGQRLAAGSVEEAVPKRMLNASQAEDYFGRGSILAAMVAAAKEVNETSEMWAVALDDNDAGVKAEGEIEFGGSPTQAGTLNVYIAGRLVQIGVGVGEDSDVTAAKLTAAINAQTDLPVTAEQGDGEDDDTVELTARNAGETGNDIDIRLNYFTGENTPRGLVVTITAMSGGTGNPDVADALAAIGDDQFYTIISPWSDASNMSKLEDELDDRWGPMKQKTGHVFTSVSGTHGDLSTYGDARNSVHSTVLGLHDMPTPPWVAAAIHGALVEFHGAIDPARPFQTLHLRGIMAPPEESRFTRAERNLLLNDGISTFIVDAGGRVLIERVITTYQENAFGVPDISFLDLNTKWTVDYYRFAVRARIALRFPRYKLANDGTNFAPGQAIVTPRVIRAELLGLHRELEEAGLVEDFEQFKNDLLVVRSNTDPNRVNAVIPPNIINQFRVFAAAVQFRL